MSDGELVDEAVDRRPRGSDGGLGGGDIGAMKTEPRRCRTLEKTFEMLRFPISSAGLLGGEIANDERRIERVWDTAVFDPTGSRRLDSSYKSSSDVAARAVLNRYIMMEGSRSEIW